MGYVSNLITEKAEGVERLLLEPEDNNEMDEFYDICQFIDKNHMHEDTPPVIFEAYTRYKKELNNEPKN